MARRALGLRARDAGRLAFEINGRPKTEPGLPARSPLCFVCLTAHELRRCCGSDRHLAFAFKAFLRVPKYAQPLFKRIPGTCRNLADFLGRTCELQNKVL